ncbi:MAG TPA: hypothetical protein VGI81_04995 [Tepidisphaeraceae bacterium]|jgi:hypothetical protein
MRKVIQSDAGQARPATEPITIVTVPFSGSIKIVTVPFSGSIDQKNFDITQSIQRQRTQKGLNAPFTAADRATVARTATRQALVELGVLQIRRPQNMSTQSQADLSKN